MDEKDKFEIEVACSKFREVMKSKNSGFLLFCIYGSGQEIHTSKMDVDLTVSQLAILIAEMLEKKQFFEVFDAVLNGYCEAVRLGKENSTKN